VTTTLHDTGRADRRDARTSPAASSEAAERVAERVAAFAALAASPERLAEPPALASLRRRAIERFGRDGFPTVRQEAWRFTNPAAATRARARAVAARRTAPGAQELRVLARLALAGCRNVLVLDGRPIEGPPGGPFEALDAEGASGGGRRSVRVRALAASWGARDGALDGLGSLADPDGANGHAFSWLNTAFFDDGVLVEADDRAVAERPIHLVHVVADHGDDGEGVVEVHPRVLVRAGRASQLTVIETYASLRSGGQVAETESPAQSPSPRALVFPVTEILCGAGAAVRHYRVDREGRGVVHLASQHLRLDRDASSSSLQLSWGGDLVRCDVHALLAGEGGDCVLDGLYLLGGRQHFDTHMRVEHLAPRCNSHELYKGVLDGAAHAVFDGRIYVHRGAQKTDAKQTNRNLLLSERAVANSNPQLEIFADDVKCTHGSTVGQLEPEALFYLRSRGLDLDAARTLLTHAFASELLGRVTVGPLRELAEQVLASRLAGGDVVAELRPAGGEGTAGAEEPLP
jgi:Fe-S cluster assembly protein SufD